MVFILQEQGPCDLSAPGKGARSKQGTPDFGRLMTDAFLKGGRLGESFR